MAFSRIIVLIVSMTGVAGPALAGTPADEVEFFEKEVRPILVRRCYECHSAESRNLKGGLRLDFAAGVLRGGDSGPAVVPRKPGDSRLIEAVGYRNLDLQMPPKGRLPAAEIAALEKWVELGAPDPRDTDPAAEGAISDRAKMTLDEARNFWSFRPVADPSPPSVSVKSREKLGPIDAFIRVRLAEHQIPPAPPADKRDLLRRATYDLIGLPPTPDEIDAFVGDTSTNAFATVIERLLKSPHYGIRWGRHWLDVARYADSNGLDENLTFGHAWRFRDYVIDSFNRDKPFDRFLIEQIAGDLLPEANQETKTATGFLALGAKVLAEKDMEKLVMDVVDEQIDTIGKAFMGLTLGCARCHSHKFDPISQEDYYGLAAIFKSTRTFAGDGRGAIKYWFEHDFASAAEREQIKAVDKELAEKKKAATSYKNAELAKLRTAARAKAAEYLMAASCFGAEASLETVAAIAEPRGLHSRILHHCRRHLNYHRQDPFFAVWHKLAPDEKRIGEHYRQLFHEAETAMTELRKTEPTAKVLKDERLEAARMALNDSSGFLALPSIPAHAFESSVLAEYERLEEVARSFESRAADLSAAMGVEDADILESIPLHIRGSHVNLGSPVRREFPEVLRRSTVRPILPATQSGRLQFAEWIADTRNPLTARVFVNRVWRWHFGRGLVSTTENFGRLGGEPSHPELLDWLARRFMKSGWQIKDLHRLIMNSATYRQSSAHPDIAVAEKADPANLLWWRFDVQRLEAEQIRDSILMVSGLLDETMGGKTIPLRNRQFVFNHTSRDHTGYDQRLRRAIYLPVVRNHLCDLFQQFDYPDPSTPTGSRASTVVAPQALLLMNSPLVMNSADAIARKLLLAGEVDNSGRVQLAYRQIYGRTANADETTRALAFIKDAIGELPLTDAVTVDAVAHAEARQQAWSLFCQSLLAANEFIYLN